MSDTKTLIPDFIIKVDQSRISLEQRASIKEIIIIEKLGSPASFQIKMSDPDLKLVNSDDFFIGNEVKISMGYKDDITQMIHGEITGISSQLKSQSGTTFIVKGHNHLHRLARAKKSFSFNDMTDTDIIEQITNDAGFSYDIEIFENEHLFTAQNNQTDLNYIFQMADRLDCNVWMENKKLFFKKQEKKSGEDIILEWKKTLLEFYPTLETNRLITEIEVRGWNIKEGETIIGSAVIDDIECTGAELVKDKFGDQVTVIIDNIVQDSNQADQLALDYLTRQSRNYISARGACEGNKDIKAGTIIKINEVGKKLSQNYQVINVKHILNIDRGYTTYFNVMSFVASAGSSNSTDNQEKTEIFKSNTFTANNNINTSSKNNINIINQNMGILNPAKTDKPINKDEKCQIINLQWVKDDNIINKARVNDKVLLTADTKNISNGTRVTVLLYEKDYEGEDDYIGETTQLVINGKIEMKWTVLYVEDKDDIDSEEEQREEGYTLPEYVFRVKCDVLDIKSEDSPVLEVRGWIKTKLKDKKTGKILKNQKYVIYLTDGSEIEGETDDEGYVNQEDLEMGKYFILLK